MEKRINIILNLLSWGFCTLMLVGIMLIGDVSAEGFAVVVNKSNDAENISFNDLAKYFNAEKQSWPNGKKVVVLLRETGSEEKKVLLEKIYKLSEEDLRKMWMGKVYKGEIASPPKAVSATSSLIKAIMSAEGGIGVVKLEEVSEDVKILKVDGKLPSDPGYPLVK